MSLFSSLLHKGFVSLTFPVMTHCGLIWWGKCQSYHSWFWFLACDSHRCFFPFLPLRSPQVTRGLNRRHISSPGGTRRWGSPFPRCLLWRRSSPWQLLPQTMSEPISPYVNDQTLTKWGKADIKSRCEIQCANNILFALSLPEVFTLKQSIRQPADALNSKQLPGLLKNDSVVVFLFLKQKQKYNLQGIIINLKILKMNGN